MEQPVESLSRKVRVLLVDDEPERLINLADALASVAEISVRDPSEVTVDDLADIDLVSVDEFFLDPWFENFADVPASLRNEDGLAVAAAFRSHARFLSKDYAVSVHTGRLEDLAAGLPTATREGLTAAQHDLDWVFAFGQPNFGERMVDLAVAVRSATQFGSSFRDDSGAAWLGIPEASWIETAVQQIQNCRPPAHALAENTGGRSYLRWLAQRILPYPTFLYDDAHSANLLGVSLPAFEMVASLLADRAMGYHGPLDEFLGRRWWRAGLQALVREIGSSTWAPSKERAEGLSRLFGVDLEPFEPSQTVVVYDLESRPTQIGADVELCVRLNLDGWPVFADDPWAFKADVADDAALMRLVAIADRPKVANDDD